MSSFTKFNAEMAVVYDREASRILMKGYWRLTVGFRYYLGKKDSNRFVDVPRGFLTDGATVPRLFWFLIPPMGEYGQATALHDYLCEHLEISVQCEDGSVLKQQISREEADEILYEAMKVLKVTQWKQNVIKTGVEFHRFVKDPDGPTIRPKKRELEAKYASAI